MAKLEKEFAPDGRLDPALFGRAPGLRPARWRDPRRLQACGWTRYRNGPAFLAAPRRGGVAPGRAQRPPGLRARRLAADDRRGRGRRARSPAAAPSWWCPTTGTWTGWKRPCCSSFPPGTSPGSPRTTARRRATAASCASSAAPPEWPSAPGPRPTRRCQNLGLVVCWDDGDDLHIEQRSPYAHSREVLLLRAGQEGAACLLAGHTRSTETQRLVASGWARPVEADRAVVRRTVPRVLNTADSFELEHDPLARIARLPGAAWRAAKEGLERGPVLVQVARAGYAPSLACENCREPARCTACSGPLAIAGPAGNSAVPQCRWCSTPAPAWRCGTCNGVRLRRGATGALRTAEELGRAFPGKARHHLLRGPGQGHRSGHEGPRGGHRRCRAGGRRRVRRGPAARRRLAAAPGKPAGGGGRRPPLVQRRRPGAAGSRGRPGGHHRRRRRRGGRPAALGSRRVRAAGNWRCGRNCSCRPPCGSPPSPAAGPPSGISPTPSSSELAAQGIVLRTAGPAPLMLPAPPARRTRRGMLRCGIPARTSGRCCSSRTPRPRSATAVLRAVKAAAAAKRSDDPVQLRLDGVDVL